MKSTLIVLLFACPLMAQAGQAKVQRKVAAKPALQKQVVVARPAAPQARTVANANADTMKMLQQTTIEIDEGD